MYTCTYKLQCHFVSKYAGLPLSYLYMYRTGIWCIEIRYNNLDRVYDMATFVPSYRKMMTKVTCNCIIAVKMSVHVWHSSKLTLLTNNRVEPRSRFNGKLTYNKIRIFNLLFAVVRHTFCNSCHTQTISKALYTPCFNPWLWFVGSHISQ